MAGGYYPGPVETIAPMDESFIGGFKQAPPSPRPPTVPPKEHHYFHGSGTMPQAVHYTPSTQSSSLTVSTSQLTAMTAVERSQVLRIARMEPHLQFMCGPLLKYDTTDEHGVWHGAALIVTSDSSSLYDPHPSLTYTYDPAQQIPTFTRQPSESQFSPPNSSASASAYPSSPLPSTSSSSFNAAGSNNNTLNSPRKRGTSFTNSRSNDRSPIRPSRISISQELGPHPADPHSTVFPVGNSYSGSGSGMPASPMTGNFQGPSFSFGAGSGAGDVKYEGSGAGGAGNGHGHPPNYPASSQTARTSQVFGQEIWVYGGNASGASGGYGYGNTFTFWRFLIKVPLGEREMKVKYSINKGQEMEFWVPGREQNMRWAAHSCNGFSAGINPDDFRGPGFKSGYDPVWMDLLSKHSAMPFHVLVGGGDQLYCDSLMREPEMQDWVSHMKPEEKKQYPLSEEMRLAIDRFFFNHYCQSFRSGAWARANCSIPMLNMCDDHDLIDGFGSYPDDLQSSPVFRQIGARGYFFFLLFQCFISVEIDGASDAPGKHVYQSLVLGDPGPYVRFPSHSFLSRLGPQVYMLLLDCRAERRKEQVCSPNPYVRVFDRLNRLPGGVKHVIFQLGIPIAYPRMVFLETALESKLNPLVALGRNGSLGLSGFVNKFNAEAELLDDLNDHWTARSHKKERNWLIEQLQNFSKVKRVRVSFLSGDVHCAAVGCFKTLKVKNKPEIPTQNDWRYMVNVVTSAIVNTPPPGGVITMVSSLATKVHKTLHHIETDETMLPIFTMEPNGQSRKQKYIMGRRNWCRAEMDDRSGELIFDIRVEREKGYGVTTGYELRVHAPAW
ncbi:hypothetical protein CPB83DRAFT_845226 [Crepidotus variabilis]|uniref:PhoD-like phosphatase domain-containing protein n=1 Tax=Crepidotus variabilis TaxID=179855 RepID=A0A9P6JUY8_9AGAR|nr:hypothetical protein CPB83DRAFT_845226 [Crepidotus variabilis]